MRWPIPVAVLACLPAMVCGAQLPFVLRYEAGDRYRFTLSHLAVHDLKEPPPGKPARLVRTWGVAATLVFKEQDGSPVVTTEEVEITGSWDDGPLHEGTARSLRKRMEGLDLALARRADGTVTLPADIEERGETAATIAECLAPVLPRDPVAVGGSWKVSIPRPEAPASVLLSRSAGRGFYAKDVDYRKAIERDGGWRPRRRGDQELATFTYTVTTAHGFQMLVVHYARAEGVVVRSTVYKWRRPRRLLASLRDQQILDCYTLTRLRSPSDDR